MSEKRFRIFTILLVLIILFCVKGTVMSKGNEQRAEENHHYLALEQEYVRNIRYFLNKQGFGNCGVMMTRVTDGEGSREYTVQIHHRRLDRMSTGEKILLKDRLSQEEFEPNVCTFRYDL